MFCASNRDLQQTQQSLLTLHTCLKTKSERPISLTVINSHVNYFVCTHVRVIMILYVIPGTAGFDLGTGGGRLLSGRGNLKKIDYYS